MVKGKRQFGTARGYVHGMYLIMTNPLRVQHFSNDTALALSFWQLSGFATELYFKAFLVAKGHLERELMHRDLRHDLSKLHALCGQEGLDVPQSKWLVDTLGEHHKIHEFRYLRDTTSFEMVDLPRFFAAFNALDFAVDLIVGASRSLGVQPIEECWAFPAELGWRLPQAPSSYRMWYATSVTLGKNQVG